MPKRVYQPHCAICALAHRWDARIFAFYLFIDIVCKVSVLIKLSAFSDSLNCGSLVEYFFLAKIKG